MATFDAAAAVTLDGLIHWQQDADAVIAKDGAHAVKLSLPADGNRVQSTSVALAVLTAHTGSGTATDVQVEIAAAVDFASPVWTTTLLALPDGYHSFVATGLTDLTKYYWRARAAYAGSGLWEAWTGGDPVLGPPGPDTPAVPVTATASSFYPDDPPTNALDGSMTTGWHTALPSPGLPHWWQADFGAATPRAVKSVTIRNRNWYIESNTDRNPKDFLIQGSNDGAAFTTLSTQTGVTWATATEAKTFSFANTTKYRYIRIHITALVAPGDNMAFQEVTFVRTGDQTVESGAWTFTVDTATGRAFGLVQFNAGVPLVSDPDAVHRVHYNAGLTYQSESEAVKYVNYNQSLFFDPDPAAVHYVHEGDVSTNTPVPHLWFLKPPSGRPGDGIRIFCFGVGDLQATYGAVVEVKYPGDRGWAAVPVIGWQTYPPTVNAYNEYRELDPAVEKIDMQHQVVEITVPGDSLPPGYPIRIRTEGT